MDVEQTDRTEHFRELQRRSAKARSVRKAEDYIRHLVDTAPPLTDEQRDRLALLLRGAAA
jgi:hypothetical protein